MIGFRYYTLSAGTPVLLKAAPVDPRDVFRGEYVMLEYDISWIKSENLASEDLQNKNVYVVLEKGEKDWKEAGLYLYKPNLDINQIYIKGKLNYYDNRRNEYRVTYGIESYYVEEGQGREIEQAKNFEAQIRIDRFGSAVIEKILIP
jgi:uncharacterized membrane-anchored protein